MPPFSRCIFENVIQKRGVDRKIYPLFLKNLKVMLKIKQIYKIIILLIFAGSIYGCTAPTGDGSSYSSSQDSYNSSGDSDDGGDDPTDDLVKTHNPEPSSILLLGSGLLGLAVFARKKRKNKA